MTPDQERELGGLLWSNSGGNNLPNLANFTAFDFLHLPAPLDTEVQAIVKKDILSLGSQGVVSQDPNGRLSMSITLGWEQPLIREASYASKPIVQLAGEPHGVVEWTAEESKQLYDTARAWWASDKAAFEIEKPGEPFSLLDPVLKTLGRLGDFLARVVIPQMKEADEVEWKELLDWLREVRSVGGFPTVALPYILLHRPAELSIVTEIIHSDLNGDIKDAIAATAKAIRHWIHLSAAGRISAPAPGLMTGFIERVSFRRKAGITSCLAQLSFLIAERPEAITLSHANLLTASLVPWHHATILPVPDETISDFPEADRPDLRVLVGRLAGALKIWYAKSAPEVPEPSPITLWQNLCAADRLPEVRRAFNAWTQLDTQST